MNRVLALALLLTALALSPVAAQSCQPFGYVNLAPCCTYDHVANGSPSSAACWTNSGPNNAELVTDSFCGWTGNAFDFTDRDSLSQTITVPSTMTQTTWSLSYLLTFVDPNNDAWWNQLQARVYNETTGQFIAAEIYRGSDPDTNCQRRDLRFTGNYAGHTLRVRFDARKGYANTTMRVRSIALYQW